MENHEDASNELLASQGDDVARFCIECGSPLKSGAKFCTNCGTEVVSPPTADNPIEEAADETETLDTVEVEEQTMGEPAADAISSEEPVAEKTIAVYAGLETPAEKEPVAAYEGMETPAAEEPVAAYAGMEATVSEETTIAEVAETAAPTLEEASAPFAEEAPEQTDASPDDAQAEEQPKEPATEKKFKPWMKIAAIVAAVIVIIAIIAGVVMSNMSKDYDQAGEYYAQAQYEEAAAAYQKLGGYKDSQEWYEKATKHIEAKKLEDEAGEDPDAWKAAAAAYEEIDDDVSPEDAERCYNTADYYTGVALMGKSDWEGARRCLKDLADKGFRDSKNLMAECSMHITYENACEAYDAGKYYEAYTGFKQLEGNSYVTFDDLDQRIKSCIQSNPGTGIVYRNSDWSNDNVELTIVNSGNPNAYYKLYRGDTLALTVFIPADSSATFRLQDGTYSMNKAYGDTWFGTEDMFGDDGSYYTCSFGGSKTFDLEANNGYEISSGGEGTGIGTTSADRNSI